MVVNRFLTTSKDSRKSSPKLFFLFSNLVPPKLQSNYESTCFYSPHYEAWSPIESRDLSDPPLDIIGFGTPNHLGGKPAMGVYYGGFI